MPPAVEKVTNIYPGELSTSFKALEQPKKTTAYSKSGARSTLREPVSVTSNSAHRSCRVGREGDRTAKGLPSQVMTAKRIGVSCC